MISFCSVDWHFKDKNRHLGDIGIKNFTVGEVHRRFYGQNFVLRRRDDIPSKLKKIIRVISNSCTS